MTKQEKIKEAWVDTYGEELYEKIKYAIKENGYIDCVRNPEVSSIINTTQYGITWGTTDYRPESISGIHNNNGWKLMEDYDLDDNEYALFQRYVPEESGEPPIFCSPCDVDFEPGYFTHYKRLILKEPLYDSK